MLALDSILASADTIADVILSRVRENLNTIRRLVKNTPLEVLNVEGGWNAMIRLPAIMTDDEWSLKFLTEADVVAQPGHLYDCSNNSYIVVSLIVEPKHIQTSVEHIVRLVQSRQD
jgi:aspartate/methionine/tyrosine aminotransferase